MNPKVVLTVIFLFFVGYVFMTAPQLPETVATHFNGSGKADGWMARSSAIESILAFGVGLPLLVILVFWLLHFVPGSMVNVPKRDFWTAPERRGQMLAILQRHSYWLACLILGLTTYLHYLVVQANMASPAQFSSGQMALLLLGFPLGILTWAVTLFLQFKRAG